MAGNYFQPTWLQPADLPSAYAKGLAIGAQIGEQQTRTRLAEAELARRAEESAQQRAYQDAALALRTKAQMRSAQAQDEYRRMVEGGMDPMKALQLIGPQLGMTGSQLASAYQSSQPLEAKFITDPQTGRSFLTRGKVTLPSGIVPDTSQTQPTLSADERFYRKPDGSWAPMPGVGVAESRQRSMDLRDRINRRLELTAQLSNARKELDSMMIGDQAGETIKTKIKDLTSKLDKLGMSIDEEDIGDELSAPATVTPKPAKSRYTIIEAR